ncbi:hypothetical protein BDZ91DRAFT_82615 [Kalaharituber pfeilii]|nr:hypothetical protein BDZ91DRAFT_82615 [Kalaharituber pfeilii]
MSNYGGRPNVNVSQFLANLNTIPSAEEQAVEPFNPDDLALFTNIQFFDPDMGEPLGDLSSGVSYAGATQTTDSKPETLQKQHFEEQDAIDSFLGYDYDYSSILQPGIPDQHLHHPQPAAVTTSSPVSLRPPGFPHESAFSATGSIGTPAPTQTKSPTPTTGTFPTNSMSTAATAKRKASVLEGATPESLEEASRLAAEEDKRRRNTAASARFRIKKKQREQALEKSAKELAEKVTALEMKINQLEMENKWLKNLITEKNSGRKESGMDISELFNAKFSAAASAPAAPTIQAEATKTESKP